MFKVSPQRVSATLFLVFLSVMPLAVMAQETPQATVQEALPQNDSAPMLDLTRQPAPSPSLATPSAQPSPRNSPVPQKSRNPVTAQSPSQPPRRAPAAASAKPSNLGTQGAQGVQANPGFDGPASTESTEGTEGTEGTEEAGGGADIPPDPNVLDNAIHTPIYTQALGKEPAPLDVPSNMPEKERSPYSILAIVLWTCFLIAAAATGYFLYIRFSDKD